MSGRGVLLHLDRLGAPVVGAGLIVPVPAADFASGVVKLDDGMILIHDLDRFLSLDEELALEKALSDAY